MVMAFGPRYWWPGDSRFEIVVGAILTQNTAWGNVEKALESLRKAGVMSREGVLRIPEKELSTLIRSSGYHNQKARKLRELARFSGKPGRGDLLGVWGIGKETADSILLYAHGIPFFVVDAYTRRVFSRLGLISGSEEYDEIRSLFENGLPKDPAL